MHSAVNGRSGFNGSHLRRLSTRVKQQQVKLEIKLNLKKVSGLERRRSGQSVRLRRDSTRVQWETAAEVRKSNDQRADSSAVPSRSAPYTLDTSDKVGCELCF